MILDASAAVELVVSTAEQGPDLIRIAEDVADVPDRALARVAHERGCPVHYCGPA